VKQRILISVLPIDASKFLLDAARQRLQSGSLGEHIRSLIERNQVIFYCEHLDLWSMGCRSADYEHAPRSKGFKRDGKEVPPNQDQVLAGGTAGQNPCRRFEKSEEDLP
jgi:hypothetical protein